MLRQLIINADDFGYTAGVSRGILKAHQAGVVTSTSVMVNFPAANTWVKRALAECPNLGLGLHLTLTAGRPAAPPDQIPDLVRDDGAFYRKDDLLPRLPQVSRDQLAAEFDAQVKRFQQIAGRLPDHLDSHHHLTYLSPILLDVFAALAHRLQVPVRNPLPRSGIDEIIVRDFLSGVAVESQRDAYAGEMLRILHGFASSSGIPMPDGFIPDFYGERAILGELLLILLDVPDGVSELMCHPGEVDDALVAQSSYTTRRQAELDALTHPSVREVIQSEFIQLVTFAAVKS